MNLIEALFHAVVDTSWRASCLIVLVLGLRRWTRGAVAVRLVFVVWIAVALRLLLPVSLPVPWSPFNFATWSRFSIHVPNSSTGADLAMLNVTTPVVAPGQVAAWAGASSFSSGLSLADWAALVWISGAAVLFLVRILACVRFARKLRCSSTPPSPAAAALLADASRSIGACGLDVLVTDAVNAPALHGIFRPRILFPPGFLEKLSPSEIRLTLAHEWAHARRRDLLADAIIHLSVVVHWFNPLVWLATRTARQDCELACDEFVLRRITGNERESYGAALLRVARLTTEASRPGFTLGVVASKGQIKRRIQMIIANKSFTLSGTLLGGAVSAALTVFSFTSEITAQTAAPASSLEQAAAPPKPGSSNIVYNPSVDRLDALFPTGVVATVGEGTITVADVRRHIAPLVPQLHREAGTQDEFNGKLTVLQNSAIKDLVARKLLIRQFHDQKEKQEEKQISAEHIDAYIANRLAEQFDGDRSKFLAYLKAKGQTQREYRKEVEEDIIYHYMRSQERKLTSAVNRPTVEREVRPVRLRIIQLTRSADDTDATLLRKAEAILTRFRNGESFETLAKEFDQGARRDRGGDWGWLGPADVRADYRDAFLALKKGEVSVPILTKEGCFLLYAEDRR